MAVPDLTVLAVPGFFGTMAAEHRVLRRRAATDGPSAADYTKADTRASLSMGVLSLVVPLATERLARPLTPGRGRYGRALLGTVAGAALATTVADLVAGREPGEAVDPRDHAVADPDPAPGRSRRRARLVARAVRRVTGPVAVGGGVLAGATWLRSRFAAPRLWAAGGHRRDLGGGPLAWAVAIGGWDLVYYWNHRFMHEVRAMWALHVVHHSSERYNLSTALRQPVADTLGFFVPYGVWSALGVRPGLMARAREINLLYQYWIHTDTVRRIGPAEEVLNTASHHRVHHGSNRRYIDRNHGSILIVWDRLFGTFQRERDDDPVVYGLTSNVDSYDPAVIATHEYRDIVRDISHSTTWPDRLGFAFRSPGWAYARHAERATAGVS